MLKSYLDKLRTNKYLVFYIVAFILICVSSIFLILSNDEKQSTTKKNDKKLQLKENKVDKDIKEVKEDVLPPVVTGILDGKTYESDVTITFDKGNATLNNTPFSTGSTVKDNGTYEFKVVDEKNNVTKITFVINKSVTTQVVTNQTSTSTGTNSNTSTSTNSNTSTSIPSTVTNKPTFVSYLPPKGNYLYKDSVGGEEVFRYSYTYLSTQADGSHYSTESGELTISENETGLFQVQEGVSHQIVKYPISKNLKWTSAGVEYELVGVNLTVAVPTGSYSNVVCVKYNNGVSTEDYYAPQAGLIKRILTFPDSTTRVMELITN